MEQHIKNPEQVRQTEWFYDSPARPHTGRRELTLCPGSPFHSDQLFCLNFFPNFSSKPPDTLRFKDLLPRGERS
eukprot:5891555-Amphidinium_carterae.1